jgi:hypothetical protein
MNKREDMSVVVADLGKLQALARGFPSSAGVQVR